MRAIALLFIATIASARDWQDANNGQIRWAMNCDFYGNDIDKQQGPGDQCGGFCVGNSQCTHFTWSDNTCYLKRFSSGSVAVDKDLNNAVCGFLPSRYSSRQWLDGNSGQVKWATGCDFYGSDVAQQPGPADQCGGFCLSNNVCTHFTWLSNVCYMKRFPDGSAIDKSLDGAVCGYVVGRKGEDAGGLGKLIWQEEFDSFDLKRWKHLVTGWRGGNNEFQYYANRRENSYVKNGFLYMRPTLTADRFGESFLSTGKLDLNKEGCNLNLDNGCVVSPGTDIINPIQSARIVTDETFSFTYGSVVVRAKMPKGDWIWPAIWMLPTGSTYGGWPRSGEIDIVEVRGNADFSCGNRPFGRQLAGSTLHWGPDAGRNRWDLTHWEKTKWTPDFSSDFHLYRVDWLSSGFTFYIDNEKIGSMSPPSGGFWQLGGFQGSNIWGSGSKMAPFDKPFHFVLNVAVGGNFFGDDCVNKPSKKPWASSDPAQMRKFWEARSQWLQTWAGEDAAMQIDYIRVYAPAK